MEIEITMVSSISDSTKSLAVEETTYGVIVIKKNF